MKIIELPTFAELQEGDRVLVVRSDGSIGVVPHALLGGSGGSDPDPIEPTPTGIDLTFDSNGDDNGLFWHLGTNDKTTAFVNPASNGLVIASQRSVHNDNPAFSALHMCTRDNNVAHTQTSTDEWFQWEIANGKKLIPNHYTFRGRRDFNGHHPRNWNLQARESASGAWVNLDVQVNNQSISYATYYSAPLITSVAFQAFRVLQTGLNSSTDYYLTGSSVEFYGKLI